MISQATKLTAVCFLLGIATPLGRVRADDWFAQLVARTQTAQLPLSNSQAETTIARSASSHEPVSFHFNDSQPSDTELIEYPSCVSHDPGKPGKPSFPLLANINQAKPPSKRYGLPNCERAGHPHEVAWWAGYPINQNYSAAFVGGGTSWVLAHKTRRRAPDEGTWGLDYDGIFKTRRVWLSWSCDRDQGGLGSYATDGAPAIAERLSKGK
jgi:hypothetical protein